MRSSALALSAVLLGTLLAPTFAAQSGGGSGDPIPGVIRIVDQGTVTWEYHVDDEGVTQDYVETLQYTLTWTMGDLFLVVLDGDGMPADAGTWHVGATSTVTVAGQYTVRESGSIPGASGSSSCDRSFRTTKEAFMIGGFAGDADLVAHLHLGGADQAVQARCSGQYTDSDGTHTWQGRRPVPLAPWGLATWSTLVYSFAPPEALAHDVEQSGALGFDPDYNAHGALLHVSLTQPHAPVTVTDDGEGGARYHTACEGWEQQSSPGREFDCSLSSTLRRQVVSGGCRDFRARQDDRHEDASALVAAFPADADGAFATAWSAALVMALQPMLHNDLLGDLMGCRGASASFPKERALLTSAIRTMEEHKDGQSSEYLRALASLKAERRSLGTEPVSVLDWVVY